MTNLLLNESCLDGLDAASVSVRFPTGLMDRICASLTFLLDRLICHCPFIRWESKLSMHWAKYGGKQTVELTNDCSDSNYSKNNGDKTCHGQDRDLMCSKFERAQVWTTFFLYPQVLPAKMSSSFLLFRLNRKHICVLLYLSKCICFHKRPMKVDTFAVTGTDCVFLCVVQLRHWSYQELHPLLLLLSVQSCRFSPLG